MSDRESYLETARARGLTKEEAEALWRTRQRALSGEIGPIPVEDATVTFRLGDLPNEEGE